VSNWSTRSFKCPNWPIIPNVGFILWQPQCWGLVLFNSLCSLPRSVNPETYRSVYGPNWYLTPLKAHTRPTKTCRYYFGRLHPRTTAYQLFGISSYEVAHSQSSRSIQNHMPLIGNAVINLLGSIRPILANGYIHPCYNFAQPFLGTALLCSTNRLGIN